MNTLHNTRLRTYIDLDKSDVHDMLFNKHYSRENWSNKRLRKIYNF